MKHALWPSQVDRKDKDGYKKKKMCTNKINYDQESEILKSIIFIPSARVNPSRWPTQPFLHQAHKSDLLCNVMLCTHGKPLSPASLSEELYRSTFLWKVHVCV